MKTHLRDRFASKLKKVDGAPEPSRRAMLAALNSAETSRLLTYGPGYKSGGR